MISRLIPSVSDTQISSPSISTTPSESGFSRLDVAVARVMVKRLVQGQFRKGPSDMLILSDNALEEWYDAEALRYLEENLKKRQQGA